MSKLDDCLEQGDLAGAIEAASSAARAQPTAPERRLVLAELLCFRGEFDRADKLVEAAQQMRTGPAPGLLIFRQLLRAELARHQFYNEGRPPEFRWELTGQDESLLMAVMELRAGQPDAAAVALAAMADEAGRLHGQLWLRSGTQLPFTGLRDLDDVSACYLESLAVDGKFTLIPYARLRTLKFNPPATLRDWLWRAATAIFDDGSTAHLFVPCLYPNSHLVPDDRIRLGRGTEWLKAGAGLMRGAGLRMLLVGDETPTLLDLEQLTFGGSPPNGELSGESLTAETTTAAETVTAANTTTVANTTTETVTGVTLAGEAGDGDARS